MLLGTRQSLEHDIHHITGLPLTVLRGSPLSSYSINERLAWAERRETTRKEDKAYSLLGIFGIHMPLIYSEGEENAFRRLRREMEGIAQIKPLPIPIASDAAFDPRADMHAEHMQVDPLHSSPTETMAE